MRGFGSSGITNGLPTVVAQGLSAGATQPLANVERIEVLKGPDAVLAGVNNLGGTINIVTKKPSAAPVLDLTGETGSFGQWRLTGDANGALNADRTVSARLIVSTNNADRNFGGYRGNMDNLVAPSIRYKDAATDVILNATLGDQSFGMPPFTLLDPGTNRPFAQPRDRPFLGVKDQGIRIETTQFFGEASRSVADWLTLTLRGQHQETDVTIRQYSPFVVFAPDGTGLISATHSRLTGVHSRTRLAALVEAWL
ncbi:TonB-dependent receptor plug domain-containing protein [Sphingomonas hankookensis]|uniref:TonB-dependent receptor plug domain-containing protein n=1 Tax=Sphingomonas hankookensis TaxID=563996 RepID=UPI003D301B8E